MIRDNALRNLFADNPVRRTAYALVSSLPSSFSDLSPDSVSMSESALDICER